VAVEAAGMGPATHAIIVGWAGEAEREAWNDANAANSDLVLFNLEAEMSSDFLGANLSRTLAAHGASLKSALGR
jgi:hypothetical protein